MDTLTSRLIEDVASLAHYFSKDMSAVTEDPKCSRWYGRAAERLRLKGRVSEEIFMRLFMGYGPNEFISRWKSSGFSNIPKLSYRSVFELTFVAPKSVSMLCEVFDIYEAREAHDAAVETVMGFIEHYLIEARIKKTPTICQRTGSAIMAVFSHSANEDFDPETHTHCVILNYTHLPDKRWRTMRTGPVKQAQHVLRDIYLMELEQSLIASGFEIVHTDETGGFEVAGFAPEQLSHFDRRSGQQVLGDEIRAMRGRRANRSALSLPAKPRPPKIRLNREQLSNEWSNRAEVLDIKPPSRHRAGTSRLGAKGGKKMGWSNQDVDEMLEMAADELIRLEGGD